jgi:hypothetical protein
MRPLIAALLLISLAAALPSDLISHSPAPDVLDLRNVDPAAPKALSAQNANLSAFGLMELPDLGHYCSWANTEAQAGPTLTDSQQGILTNNSTNDTVMIYL